jgi:hypothetical protein
MPAFLIVSGIAVFIVAWALMWDAAINTINPLDLEGSD